MEKTGSRPDNWLTAVVLTHLVITFVHGAAHQGAAVPLGLLGTIFVVLVIEVGPLAGLAVARFRPSLGGWIVAASMAGALVFGFVNHFILISPDHVSHVNRAREDGELVSPRAEIAHRQRCITNRA